jgi:hypothetical protein
MEYKEPFHQPWMDEPMVEMGEYEVTQISMHEGNVYLASRWKNGDKFYQHWHIPVRRRRGSKEEYTGGLRDKRPTQVVLGGNLLEAKETLKFFLEQIDLKLQQQYGQTEPV